MTDHLQIQLLAAAAVDESLPDGDAAELSRHLEACATCRSAAAGMRLDHRALGELSAVPTAPWVRESILDAARGRRGPARWLLLAAALLLLALSVGIGLVGARLLLEYRSLITVEPVELSTTLTPVAVALPNDGSRIRAVAATHDGYIAGGASAAGATIWSSHDGLAWDEQVELPIGESAEVAALVSTDATIIAAGRSRGGAVIWRQASPGSWEAILLPGTDSGGGVNALLTRADGLIAVGWRSDGGARAGAVWQSTGGLEWTSASTEEGTELRAVASLPVGGFVATRAGEPETAPLLSDDGSRWASGAQSAEVFYGLPGRVSTVVRFGDHVYAIGIGSPGSLVMWRSTDGVAWSDVAVPTLRSVEVNTARVVEGRLIVAGSTSGSPLALAMSADGAFDELESDAPLVQGSHGSFYDVTGTNGRLIAVGVQGEDAAVWASE